MNSYQWLYNLYSLNLTSYCTKYSFFFNSKPIKSLLHTYYIPYFIVTDLVLSLHAFFFSIHFSLIYISMNSCVDAVALSEGIVMGVSQGYRTSGTLWVSFNSLFLLKSISYDSWMCVCVSFVFCTYINWFNSVMIWAEGNNKRASSWKNLMISLVFIIKKEVQTASFDLWRSFFRSLYSAQFSLFSLLQLCIILIMLCILVPGNYFLRNSIQFKKIFLLQCMIHELLIQMEMEQKYSIRGFTIRIAIDC